MYFKFRTLSLKSRKTCCKRCGGKYIFSKVCGRRDTPLSSGVLNAPKKGCKSKIFDTKTRLSFFCQCAGNSFGTGFSFQVVTGLDYGCLRKCMMPIIEKDVCVLKGGKLLQLPFKKCCTKCGYRPLNSSCVLK